MYQICPKCKKVIEDGNYCSNCKHSLEVRMESSRGKLTRKDLTLYALGYILLAYVAFVERDLTNRADLMEGVVVFGGFVLFSTLWFYIRGRGGLGRPPYWGF